MAKLPMLKPRLQTLPTRQGLALAPTQRNVTRTLNGQFVNAYAHSRWRARRAAQLKAEPLCAFCLQQGRTRLADIADHIVPHRGNEHAFWHGALQSLCHHCHVSAKQRQEHGAA